MGDNMRTGLIQEALACAVANCPHERGVTIFHSDRGSQYMSESFAATMRDYGIVPSCGRTGVLGAPPAWSEACGGMGQCVGGIIQCDAEE